MLCVGVLAVGGSACQKEIISAYDIAVKNGFVGTEQEWLESLRGADGQDAPPITIEDMYKQAKAEGFTGTYLEFCKELGIDALEGNDVAQIADNMMSVVGIYCGWTKTTFSGGVLSGKEVDYSMSMGSGVIVDFNKQAGNAYIITNYHVIYNKDSDAKGICNDIYLYLHGAAVTFGTDDDGNFVGGQDGMRATYVGGAMDYDIAVLKVEGSAYLQKSNATQAVLGNSETLTEGEKVFAIGNPDGAGISVTSGILSVKSEYIDIEAIDERDVDGIKGTDTVSYRVMRTDAAINGGNSGGGLFNTAGELIGITNAKSVGTDKDDMGYALPMLDVKAVYENIMDNGVGYVKRAMLGVMVSTLHGVAEKNEADGTLNVVQTFKVAEEVAPNSFSYGKLQKDDVFVWGQIISSDGKAGEKVYFDRQYQLNAFLLNVREGDTVRLGIRRTVLLLPTELSVELKYGSSSNFVAFK